MESLSKIVWIVLEIIMNLRWKIAISNIFPIIFGYFSDPINRKLMKFYTHNPHKVNNRFEKVERNHVNRFWEIRWIVIRKIVIFDIFFWTFSSISQDLNLGTWRNFLYTILIKCRTIVESLSKIVWIVLEIIMNLRWKIAISNIFPIIFGYFSDPINRKLMKFYTHNPHKVSNRFGKVERNHVNRFWEIRWIVIRKIVIFDTFFWTFSSISQDLKLGTWRNFL